MITSMLQMGMGEQGTIGNLSCEAGTHHQDNRSSLVQNPTTINTFQSSFFITKKFLHESINNKQFA